MVEKLGLREHSAVGRPEEVPFPLLDESFEVSRVERSSRLSRCVAPVVNSSDLLIFSFFRREGEDKGGDEGDDEDEVECSKFRGLRRNANDKRNISNK